MTIRDPVADLMASPMIQNKLAGVICCYSTIVVAHISSDGPQSQLRTSQASGQHQSQGPHIAHCLAPTVVERLIVTFGGSRHEQILRRPAHIPQ